MLYLSIIALFIGPLLYFWLRQGGLVARTVEQAIVAALVVLVVFLLVPEAFREMGVWAFVLMAAGYGVPGLLEKVLKQAAHAFHVISLVLALLGLIVHAMLDGAALAAGATEAGSGLALAVVLHRFGVGLVLWFMVQPVFGRYAAFGVLAVMGLATALGQWFAETLVDMEHLEALHAIQSVVIGMIIHSLVHRSHTHTHDQCHGEGPDDATLASRDGQS